MNGNDMDNAIIRHINLSGEMYSRLVYGEENTSEKYFFQKEKYIENRIFIKLLERLGLLKVNLIKPRFRRIDRSKKYIFIVSLWGDIEVRKKILQKLYEMKQKFGNIKIVGYWGDPAFDLKNYTNHEIDLLVTSHFPHAKEFGASYIHLPVPTMGTKEQNTDILHDCFNIGSYTNLRLNKIINSEKQFKKSNIDCFWCIAGLSPNKEQQLEIDKISQYRKFPDLEFMSAKETLKMSTQVNVMLNISRLSNSYQTNPTYYSIIFNKKLITDTESIKESPYYNPKYMKVVNYNNPNWLNKDLVEWIKKREKINYGYKNEWMPEVFYQKIRRLIQDKER
jgi:hypothetical protein